MSYILPKKIQNLVPYDPISGNFSIRLDANESFLPLDEKEISAIEEAVRSVDLRRYPDSTCRELLSVAAGYFGISSEFLTAWNGLDECLSVLSTAFLGEKKRVLLFDYDFSMYQFYAHLAGSEVIMLKKTSDFSIDLEDFLCKITEFRPDVCLFSNPCNPTSIALSRESVKKILEVSGDSGTLVVLDEAYVEFSGNSLILESVQHDNLILLRTCSKAAGLAGLRLGFSVANETLTRALRAAKSPYNVNALTQSIGAALLRQGNQLRNKVQKIQKNRDFLSKSVQNLGFFVAGDSGNFLFLPDAGPLFEPLCARGIVTRRFGAHLRITVGNEAENCALLQNMKELKGEFYAKR